MKRVRLIGSALSLFGCLACLTVACDKAGTPKIDGASTSDSRPEVLFAPDFVSPQTQCKTDEDCVLLEQDESCCEQPSIVNRTWAEKVNKRCAEAKEKPQCSGWIMPIDSKVPHCFFQVCEPKLPDCTATAGQYSEDDLRFITKVDPMSPSLPPKYIEEIRKEHRGEVSIDGQKWVLTRPPKKLTVRRENCDLRSATGDARSRRLLPMDSVVVATNNVGGYLVLRADPKRKDVLGTTLYRYTYPSEEMKKVGELKDLFQPVSK